MENKKELTVKDIIEICQGELICGNKDVVLNNFCQDTRVIKQGDVYVGVKGENHNGNDIYEEALENGARVCILQGVEVPEYIKEKYYDRSIVIVKNTIYALQELAKYKRCMYDIPVVAITGSVGKTSTKDIVASVMARKFNVLKTEGNYNSQLGTALTVLRLKNHNAMVVELGMNSLGEISRLTDIVKPTVAVITNVGTAHIGLLGSRENILKAKLEILEGLQSEGKVVINNDNDMLNKWNLEKSDIYNVITYGMENVSDIMAYNTKFSENGSDFDVDIEDKTYSVHVDVGGNHFVSNSLCAIAVGRIFNMNMSDILDGIAHFELTKRRMQIEKLDHNVIVINDCYNANCDSMKAAIHYLSELKDCKKVAVLGDMLELGEYSEKLHREVGEELVKDKIDIVITVGKDARYIADEVIKGNNTKVYEYNNNQYAIEKIKEIMQEGNVVILIKASNGMNFQEIASEICK